MKLRVQMSRIWVTQNIGPMNSNLLNNVCRFLSRVDREFGIFQHVAPTMRLLFEFPHETGLIQRFAGNVGNPLQTKHGNRPFCRDQEGWRGSQEVVPWTLVFPSSETGMSGNFGGRIKGSYSLLRLEKGCINLKPSLNCSLEHPPAASQKPCSWCAYM